MKLHLTLFHGSKGRRRTDAAAPVVSATSAISAASAAQAFANLEFGPSPFVSKPATSTLAPAASPLPTRNGARAPERIGTPFARHA